MKSRLILFFLISAISSVTHLGAEKPGISLMRFSAERVSLAKNHYTRRMRKAKGILTGVVMGVPAAVLGGWWALRKGRQAWNRRGKAEEISRAKTRLQDSRACRQNLVEKINLSFSPQSSGTNASAMPDPSTPQSEMIQALNVMGKTESLLEQDLKRLEGQQEQPQNFFTVPQSPSNLFSQTLKMGVAIGVAGLIITAGHQIFRVTSGTLDEMIQLWWRGYHYWYRALEEQTRGIMTELREVLYQARRTTQQTPTEQQLLVTRQQRRGNIATEMNSHYRLDIITLYQRLVGSFERLVGLMLIIASPEQQMAVQQSITTIAEHLNAVAQSLECDLNDSIQGVATHYSNETLDRYYEVVEAITVYFTTFRMYLKK